jgi:hypothetical protein
MLEIQGQNQIAPRLQFLLTNLFAGDMDHMARATGTNKAVLRDILRGRTVNATTLRDLVKRVSMHHAVSGLWLKAGHGSATAKSGEAADISSSEANGESGAIVAARKDDVDVFVTFAQRLQRAEEAIRSIPKPADYTKEFGAIHKRLDELAERDRAVGVSIAELKSKAQEFERSTTDRARECGRFDSALLAIRKDLDQAKVDIVSLQDLATQPKEAEQREPRRYTCREFLDKPFEASRYFQEKRIPIGVIANYLQVLSIAADMEETVAEDGNYSYSYEQFTLLFDYLKGPDESGAVPSARSFVAWAKPILELFSKSLTTATSRPDRP